MAHTATPLGYVDAEVRTTMVQQIGGMTILGISGGRITPIGSGIELPVASGYHVRISYTADDLYLVERVYRRGLKEWVKGSRDGVYADELAEVAHRAGMFHSYTAEQWVGA